VGSSEWQGPTEGDWERLSSASRYQQIDLPQTAPTQSAQHILT